MYTGTISSKFIQILGKIGILQTRQRVVDYFLTGFWTLVGMVVPVVFIVVTQEDIVSSLNSGTLIRVIPFFHKTISKFVVLILQVPIICSIGILNPDLVKDSSLQLPARPLLWLTCILEIGFAFVQYIIRIISSMEKTCSTNGYVCSLNVITIFIILQFMSQRILTITIVGLSSKQVIKAWEPQIGSLQTVSYQINLFRNMKAGLSALLFVSLSYEILDCIVNSFNLMYGKTDKMEGLIQTLFSFSIVFYYCLSLDDCFVAFKNQIAVAR